MRYPQPTFLTGREKNNFSLELQSTGSKQACYEIFAAFSELSIFVAVTVIFYVKRAVMRTFIFFLN
jgi:hypothetical protein